jgi:uncharacterized membrane protein
MSALTPVYWIIGLVLATTSVRAALDRTRARPYAASAFWGLLALVFIAADWMPPMLVGAIVLALALIAGSGGVVRPKSPETDLARSEANSKRIGASIFVPALMIPILTVLLVFAFKALERDGEPMFDANSATMISLAVACVISLAIACVLVRRGPQHGVTAASDLVEAIGWPLLLPPVLATLGALFQAAGAGEAIAQIVGGVVPIDSRLACVLAYALGMVVFTMVMGNAFAAFPVITAGIGLPLLVMRHGAEPASMAALGMLCGYCGTLMTPMAANFNIVPAALLELRDQHAVIRAQLPTALPLLACNIVLMYFIVFR